MSRFGEGAARLSSIASQLLGWRPDEFWNCTPMELALAIDVAGTVDPPDATTIEQLRRRFPDQGLADVNEFVASERSVSRS